MNRYQRVEILLAEDSPEDAEMTLRTLQRRGIANRVEWVRDGAEAIDFLYNQGNWSGRTDGNPRLLLLDLKMPRMDGLQVLERLKQDPGMRAIPVVVLTSSREEADLVRSYQLGVNSYIVKPVDFEQFAAMVAEVGMYWMITNQTPTP